MERLVATFVASAVAASDADALAHLTMTAALRNIEQCAPAQHAPRPVGLFLTLSVTQSALLE